MIYGSYKAILSAYCYAQVAERLGPAKPGFFPENRVHAFVMRQVQRLTQPFRFGVVVATTLLFQSSALFFYFKFFPSLSPDERNHLAARLKRLPLPPVRDLFQLYDSLIVLKLAEEMEGSATQ
jgi:hypothetical protein